MQSLPPLLCNRQSPVPVYQFEGGIKTFFRFESFLRRNESPAQDKFSFQGIEIGKGGHEICCGKNEVLVFLECCRVFVIAITEFREIIKWGCCQIRNAP